VTSAERIRVVVVDDQALVRAGFRMILEAETDLVVAGEAADGEQAVALISADPPDVVLMDVRMPDVDGIAGTERVRALPDPPRVIVLTTFHLDDYVFGALRAGASGFLLKDTAPTDIVAAVRLVAAGEAMLSPAVTRTLIDYFVPGGPPARRRAAEASLRDLSVRERQVAVEVAHGHSNADIAREMRLSEATVKAHVSRLLTKLGVTNRVQVAITVRDAGLG
jgi:DNA-binding NarL/FixJ family response regulator